MMPLFETSSPAPRRLKIGAAAIGLLVVGGVAGGAIGHEFRPPIEMAPTHVVAIRGLAASEGIVTIRGRVAESFGSRLVIDDGTGRTLVDAGPGDRDGGTVPLGAVVAVQGRYARDGFRPSFLIGPNGTVTPMGPPHGHHHGPGHGGPDRGGPDREGPEGPGPRGPEQGPPPAAPAPAPAG